MAEAKSRTFDAQGTTRSDTQLPHSHAPFNASFRVDGPYLHSRVQQIMHNQVVIVTVDLVQESLANRNRHRWHCCTKSHHKSTIRQLGWQIVFECWHDCIPQAVGELPNCQETAANASPANAGIQHFSQGRQDLLTGGCCLCQVEFCNNSPTAL